MVAEESRGAISDREIESHIRFEQPTITPHKRYCGIVRNGFFVPEKNIITIYFSKSHKDLIICPQTTIKKDIQENRNKKIDLLKD